MGSHSHVAVIFWCWRVITTFQWWPCGHSFLTVPPPPPQSPQWEGRASIAVYHHTSRYVLLIHALSEVESHSLTVLCVSYTSPIAPIYFICLAPEDIGFCDLWLQVWVRGESSEVTLPFSYCQTQQCSPLWSAAYSAESSFSAHRAWGCWWWFSGLFPQVVICRYNLGRLLPG